MDENDPRFDVILDANDPNFAEQFADALGLQPGETVQIVTPQFDRTDGVQPVTAGFEFANLPSYPDATLEALGCCRWDEPDENGDTLWLYPGEWYGRIPEGHVVSTISGEDEPFRSGATDDDCRFGMLAYGFKKPAAPQAA